LTLRAPDRGRRPGATLTGAVEYRIAAHGRRMVQVRLRSTARSRLTRARRSLTALVTVVDTSGTHGLGVVHVLGPK
jgi:hypothetical protein